MSSVVNASDCAGGEILEWIEKESKSEDAEYDDVTDIHFYTLKTDRGYADVTLHVEHNGYYGGWLNAPGEFEGDLPVEQVS